ncbi:MAG: PTS sugar transporter subunit IIB [Erysipelotrichaceae bacterium]|uniref:PTS sugar transporter subunit IIB n=1 Tax=Anaerorhabdus sp. TaxID=1872524 RepID=UPI002FC86283
MIKLVRVDHRLLHGQVAFSWTNAVSADCILIASDSVVNDDMWKTTLKLGKPSGVKLVIKNMEDAISSINSGVTDKYKLLIVVQTIQDAWRLVEGCSSIESINLGGSKKQEGYRQISKAIYIGSEEEQCIKKMLDKKVEVEIRQLASEKKLQAQNVL